MVNFPSSIFTPRTVANKSGVIYDASKETVSFAEDYSNPAAEIAAIETELGVNTKGAYSSVKAWLTALTSAIGGIITNFLGLDDTPDSYTDQAGKVVAVNDEEDGLEFIDPPSGGFTSKARAYRNSSAQVISNDISTKVQLNAETFDVDSEFDIATNYRFTAKTAGYYLVTGQIGYLYSSTVDGKRYSCIIRKNNATAAENCCQSASSAQNYLRCNVSDIIYLGVNDYVELFTSHTSGVNASIANGSDITFLAVHKLS